jgi:hypothetical protein
MVMSITKFIKRRRRLTWCDAYDTRAYDTYDARAYDTYDTRAYDTYDARAAYNARTYTHDARAAYNARAYDATRSS